MRKIIFHRFFIVLFILLASVVSAQNDSSKFRIVAITYDIKGQTREFPLSRAVPISSTMIFPDRASLDFYLADIKLQLSNKRVLDAVSLDTEIGEIDGNGIVPVHLTVHTVDSWNVIALPKPSFDSNSGFQLKLKLKDYNFFGSMQELNADVSYAVDNDSKSSFSSELSFDIPFEYLGYAMSWNNTLSATFPQGVVPQFNFGTGLSIDVPITSFAKIVFSVDQDLVINDRTTVDTSDGGTETVLYDEDPCYFNEKFSTSVPFTLYSFSSVGDLLWTPDASVQSNLANGGMHADDLKGTKVEWGHGFSLGRTNWYGNFRHGVTVAVNNDYSYNLTTSNIIDSSISGTTTAFYSFFDKVGINSRMEGFYNFGSLINDNIGGTIRGILDNRIDTDTGVSLNLDIPIKILDVDFEEVTGVRWSRFIGFEMQISPFFDMMLTHDQVTGRYYALKDGWYGGGVELLIFPKKMRSIFGRISYGVDLGDMAANGWKQRSTASRDDASTKELFIGLGLAY